MDHVLSSYGGLLIGGAVAVVLLLLIIRIVNAVVRLVSLLVLLAVLAGGYTVYGRISAIQQAVDAAAHRGSSGVTTATALADAVTAPAKQALTNSGLNPNDLRIRIVCAGSRTRIQLRYDDPGFMFGLLNRYYDVPHDSRVRC